MKQQGPVYSRSNPKASRRPFHDAPAIYDYRLDKIPIKPGIALATDQ
jgi:hypothetical protein